MSVAETSVAEISYIRPETVIWDFAKCTVMLTLLVFLYIDAAPMQCFFLYLSIFLYVLTPEGDIRRVPGNQVLGVIFSFCSFCAMLVLVVSERKASACLIMLSAKQGSHWYYF